MSDERGGLNIACGPRYAALDVIPWVKYVVTTRDAAAPLGGDMSFTTGASEPEGVIENRLWWLSQLGRTPEDAVMSGLVHGTDVRPVGRREGGNGVLTPATMMAQTDGLMTDEPGVTLMMCFADCVPLIAVDTERRVIGLAHAGWRGTLAGMAGALVNALRANYGSDRASITGIIGPSIGPEAYTVGADVVEPFLATYPADRIINESGALTRLDLWEANASQLRRAGLPGAAVHKSGTCTYEHGTRYFSHRYARATGEREGRFAVLLTIEG